MNNTTLLPFNATLTEKTLEKVILRSTALPVPVDTLWNANTCPAPLLPWLAWALSVDTWDSHWPQSTQRTVIANSIEIHRRKGTVAAVRQALASLAIVIELSEWFEHDGIPHTFSLMAWVGDNLSEDQSSLINPDYYAALRHAVDVAKPVRSHYDITVGILFKTTLGIAMVMQHMSYCRIHMEVT